MTLAREETVVDRAGAVFDYLDQMVDAADAPKSWRDLLRIHLSVGRRQAEAAAVFPCADLPILVHAAITGNSAAAVPLAAACTLVYLGADLFDNLADEELPEEWAGCSPSQISLAAATMLAPLPQLALSGMGRATSPETMLRVSQAVAQTLLTMGIGQHEDLLFSSREGLTADACRRVAERKAGGELAGFARAAAVLAGAGAEVEDAYATFGSCWGTASQIASDLADVWDPAGSNDLLNGTRTLPIVHAMTVLEGAERLEFDRLLERSRHSSDHAGTRTVLRRTGSVTYTMLVVQVYVRRAAAALDSAGAGQPARGELERLLKSGSLIDCGD